MYVYVDNSKNTTKFFPNMKKAYKIGAFYECHFPSEHGKQVS